MNVLIKLINLINVKNITILYSAVSEIMMPNLEKSILQTQYF